MKTVHIILTAGIIEILTIFNYSAHNKFYAENNQKDEMSVFGRWVRIGPNGPVAVELKENGVVETDFGNDGTTDVISEFEIRNDTIIFTDKEGQMCRESGIYKLFKTDYYLAFHLVEDDCGGRIKTTMGYWTRPEFAAFLAGLDKEISDNPKPKLFLTRARINLAIGNSIKAKSDLDVYIKNGPSEARVYINRAGTRFPNDMEGVVSDCNKAISLEPNNKNAYFLRGLARYELGEKEQACEDFSKAIVLGFSILEIAEHERCSEFWNKE